MIHPLACAAAGGARRPEARLSCPWSPTDPLRAGEPLDASRFMVLRRRAVLEGCKWDPQVGDVSTLAAFPRLLSRAAWSRLAGWAEVLARDPPAAENGVEE